jgi:hypothetical protein
MVDPKNPYKMYPGTWMESVAQFQNDGKISWVVAEKMKAIPGSYIPPAKLRTMK